DVRFYGDTGIAAGIETLAGTAKGYVPGARRFTNVWIKRRGQWQQVAGASTIVSKETSSTASLSTVKDLKSKTIAGTTTDARAALQADQAYARTDTDKDDAKAKTMETKDYSFVSRAGVLSKPDDPPGPQHTSSVVAYDVVHAYGNVAVVQGSLLWSDVNQ